MKLLLQGRHMCRFIVLMFIFVSLSFNVNAAKSNCTQSHCIAVVDAGSSGSRLHVYAYDLDSSNSPIKINEIWNRKVLPGLSTIEHEHGSISAYLEKLFQNAPAVLMPVYFYSTAGMRLLPKTHHSNVNQLVADWFDKQYYWRLITARTISGQEEGIFAWLAINYGLDLLSQAEKPLVGVMDIGGGSVQIIIPATNDSNLKSDPGTSIDLYGKHFKIFSHSFLGLGQNEMGHQYSDLEFCYPNEFELPSGGMGHGDTHNCKSEITTLVNKVHYVEKRVKPILAQNPVKDWYIMGGVTNLLNDKFFPFSNQQFTIRDLLQAADKQVCHRNWPQLEESNPNNFMLYNYCMLSSYLSALIVNGYGIPSKQVINFMPQNKSLDWTIGVVLQHHET